MRTSSRFRGVYRGIATLGIDLRTIGLALAGFPAVLRERREYQRQRWHSREPDAFPIRGWYPIFADRFDSGGTASGHYFHQDLMVAREVFKRNPTRHVDVGSSVYGFVSHVASFREIEVFDVRATESTAPGISFVQADLMNLDESYRAYADSISCLHALEHFGLGRYGDPICYDGWRKGLASLRDLLAPGGVLYLSVPTGAPQRVEFNAHRVFALGFLRDVLMEDFYVEEMAFVDDAGALHRHVDPQAPEPLSIVRAHYGCSIWILRSPTNAGDIWSTPA